MCAGRERRGDPTAGGGTSAVPHPPGRLRPGPPPPALPRGPLAGRGAGLRRRRGAQPPLAHRHAGIDLHRSLHLDTAADTTHVRGIPATTIARTLLDYAAVATRHQLARALHQADLQQILDVAAIRAQCRRNPPAPGARRLSAEFAFPDELSDSPLEDRFIAARRAFGGPEPERQPYVDPGDGGILLRP